MRDMPEVTIAATKHTLEICEEVARSDGITLAELVDSLDMPKSTVYDHLRTLSELNYVVRNDDGYRIGLKFLKLGGRRRRDMSLYQTAKPELKELADKTGEHVTLVVEEYGMGILLETIMGSKAVEVFAPDGTRTYLHTTAPGKAILAHMPQDRVSSVLDTYGGGERLPGFASETVTDPEELFEELNEIRERGYAFDVNESLDGMRGVAAPIIRPDDKSVAGAISVYGPVNRTDTTEFEEEIPELLLQTTNVVEVNLTYA